MISDNSKRCFISVIKVCYILNATPYKLVTPIKNGIIKLEISPRLMWYKINTVWNLTFLLVLSILLICRVVENNFEPLLTLLIAGILTLITCVVTYQIILFSNYKELLIRLNGSQVVQYKLGKVKS